MTQCCAGVGYVKGPRVDRMVIALLSRPGM
jgi:hypothetical protein